MHGLPPEDEVGTWRVWKCLEDSLKFSILNFCNESNLLSYGGWDLGPRKEGWVSWTVQYERSRCGFYVAHQMHLANDMQQGYHDTRGRFFTMPFASVWHGLTLSTRHCATMSVEAGVSISGNMWFYRPKQSQALESYLLLFPHFGWASFKRAIDRFQTLGNTCFSTTKVGVWTAKSGGVSPTKMGIRQDLQKWG